MSRKDYTALAEAIRLTVEEARAIGDRTALGGVRILGRRVADVLAADNPRFDRARFLAAAGIDTEVPA